MNKSVKWLEHQDFNILTYNVGRIMKITHSIYDVSIRISSNRASLFIPYREHAMDDCSYRLNFDLDKKNEITIAGKSILK
jgi:hypothetical protein